MSKSIKMTVNLGPKMSSALKDLKLRRHSETGQWTDESDLARELIWGGLKRREMSRPGELSPIDFSSNE